MTYKNSIPGVDQPIWSSYVYYVVLSCTCGHSYYYPARRQIDFDRLTPEQLHKEIEQLPERVDTVCQKCGRPATAQDARRAVVGLGMADRSGCILCDLVIEDCKVVRTRFRFDATPDPIQYFREHPDYFRTRPPDGSPLYLDNQLCLEELGRAMSVRSAWAEIMDEALESGSSFMRVDEGYYIFATSSHESDDVERELREQADESFWEYFKKESIPRRRLNGIDRWSDKQREQVGLRSGIYSDWLAPEVAQAIQNQRLYAVGFVIESVMMEQLSSAAAYFNVELNEVLPADGSEPQLWMRNEHGLMRPFPPLELIQLLAVYKGRLISDQIWLTFDHLVKSLEKEEQVYERFSSRLPPGYSASWADPGKLLISRGDHPMEMLTFAHISDNIDPNDEEALGRLISWLVCDKKCECHRYVGKRLMSRDRFHECSAELHQDAEAFVYRERDDELVEIYTDECRHHVIFGLRQASGNIERAEALFNRDLAMQRYTLRYTVRKGFLRGVQMVALMGQDAASIATHPALMRGVLSDLKVRFGDRVRVYAPFNGILAIAQPDIDAERLEKFAYEVARETPESPELKSDHLGYSAVLELADEPLGQFELEAFDHNSKAPRL